MTVADLKDYLCKDLVVNTFKRQNREFIATKFTYPNGDSVNVYLVDDEGQQRISDLGTTHYFLRVADVDMDTDARVDFVKSICAGFDIELGNDFVLSKPISAKTASDDVLNFCQAIIRISALHYDTRAQQEQRFVKEVDKLITATIPVNKFSRR